MPPFTTATEPHGWSRTSTVEVTASIPAVLNGFGNSAIFTADDGTHGKDNRRAMEQPQAR